MEFFLPKGRTPQRILPSVKRIFTGINRFLLFSTILLVLISPDTFGQVDANVVGYWKMDESSGTTVSDQSANGLTGTFVGPLSFVASSAFPGAGNALNFPGNGYVRVPHNNAINTMQNSMTIEAWVYQTDNVNNAIVDRGNYNFLFMSNPNGQPGLGFYNGSGGWSYSTSSTPVNQWFHAAMTWDGNTRTLKLYTNGVLTDTFVRPSGLFFNNSELNIGRQQPDGCRCNLMNGRLDEVRLSNVVRTPSEIQNSANGTAPDTTPPTVIAQDITVQLDANGGVSITPEDINNGSSDDSGTVFLSLDQTSFDCDDLAGTGLALDFDGANDYLPLSTNTLPVSNTQGNPWTIEFWVNGSGLNDRYIYTEGNANDSFDFLGIRESADGINLFFRNFERVNLISISTTQAILDNTWHHYAFTTNGVNSASVYVDGVLDNTASFNVSGTTNKSMATIGALRRNVSNLGNFFEGKIDEFRIWTTERSAAEIANNYQNALTGTESGLAALFGFEDGAGSNTVADNAGSNNGTLTSMDSSSDWVEGIVGSSGQNTVTLTVTDPSGNSASTAATVTVQDVSAPTITLDGASSIDVEANDTFNDPGATAADNCAASVETSGAVDFSTPGSYTLSYKAVDGSGNESATITRTVNVIAPTITISGDTCPPSDLTATVSADVTSVVWKKDGVQVGTGTTFTAIQPGTYTAEASNAGGYTVTSDAIVVNLNTIEAPAEWSATAGISVERNSVVGTKLQDGRVLLTGGYSFGNIGEKTTEIYDPATGQWTATGDMTVGRAEHNAILLQNGQVLVTTGFNGGYTQSSDLYDPNTGTWSPTGDMMEPTLRATATLLNNGNVFVTGGFGPTLTKDETQVYDVASGTWSYGPTLAKDRNNHTATLMADGRVLIVGGANAYGQLPYEVEIYDPVTNTISAAAPINNRRYYHSATLLNDGRVLVVGGVGANTTAELYDPVADTWTIATPMNRSRQLHTAHLMPNGKVLLVAGSQRISELYDPTTNTWSDSAEQLAQRNNHASFLLNDGRVLLAGGYLTTTSEIYSSSVTISGDKEICIDGSTQLTSNVAGGVWSSDDDGIASVDSNGNVTSVSVGSTMINYTLVNDFGCTVVFTHAITVSPLPTATVVSQGFVCIGDNSGTITVTATNGTAPYEYSIDGGNNYQASNEFTRLAAGNYPVYIRDVNGCANAVEVVTIVQEDNVFPTVTLIGDATVYHNAYTAYNDAGVNITDNCSATSGTTTNVNENVPGTYTVTYTGTDPSGNQASATRTVVVQDVTDPVAIAQDITIQLDASGNASITAEDIDNGSSDDSGNVTLSIDQTTFDCDDVGSAAEAVGMEYIGTDAWTVHDWGGAYNPTTKEFWYFDGSVIKVYDENKQFVRDFNPGTSQIMDMWIDTDSPSDYYTANWNLHTITKRNGSNEIWSYPVGAASGIATDDNYVYAVGYGRQNVLVLDKNTGAFVRNIPLPNGGQIYGFGNLVVANGFLYMSGNAPQWSDHPNVYNYYHQVDMDGNYIADGYAGPDQARYIVFDGEIIWSTDYQTPTVHGVRISDGNAFGGGAGVAVSLTVTDPSGNTATAQALVIVEDNSAPTITINGDATVYHDAFTAYTDAGAIAEDNCSATLITDNSVNANVLGTYTVTYTATDASGNETTATRTVIVQDVTNPIAMAQDITVQLDANGNASITAEDIDNGSSDDSGNVTLSIDQTAFDCDDIAMAGDAYALDFDGINDFASFPLDGRSLTAFTYEVNLRFTKRQDGSIAQWGNSVTNTNPYMLLYYQSAGNLVLKVDRNFYVMSGVVPDLDTWYHVAVTHDGSSWSLYVDGDLKRNFSAGAWEQYNATSIYLGSSHAGYFHGQMDEIRVWDDIRTQSEIIDNAPTTIDPNSANLIGYYSLDEGTGTTFANLAVGSDGTLWTGTAWTTETAIGGASSGNQVTLTVTDPSGNTVTATANVTVEDNIAPQITAPADISVLATSAAGAVVNYTAPAGTDNCAVTTELTAGEASGATFPIGTTLVTYTATDASGNIASASFNVTVTGLPPQIVAPANITVDSDAGVCGAIVNFEATETTAIPTSTITYDIQPGTFFPVGTTTVTATASNAVGTSSESFTVTVEDNEAPNVITQDIVVDLDASGNATISIVQIDNNSSDNCGIESLRLNNVNFTCSNVGENTVILTVTDIHGNSASETATVIVRDVTKPTVLTKDISVQLDASGNASITADDINNGSNDACGIASTTIDISSFTCTNVFATNVVTLTVTDVNGNVETGTAIVTVEDNIAPEVITQPITVALGANGEASIQPSDVDAGSSDACGVTLNLDNNAFNCSTLGENTVILTVTDPSGNSSSASAIVTVIDNAAPTIVTNPITVQLDNDGQASIIASQLDGGTTDNCGVQSLTIDITSFTCDNLGDNIVTITATDVNGNTATAAVNVEVVDIIPPTVGTRNVSVELDENGQATITHEDVLMLSEEDIETGDNCTASAAESHAVWLSQYVKKNEKRKSGRRWNRGWWNNRNYPQNTRFVFDAAGGSFNRNLDGTATVTGTIRSTADAEDLWVVTLNLENARDWDEWSAIGRKYKREGRYVRSQYKDWTYYEMAEGSKLTGAGKNEGEEIALSHAPADYRYGFQLGDAANLKNGNYGLSGWFSYRNRKGRRVQGDFNLDITDCTNQPVPDGTVITSDNCSLDSFSLSQSSFTCTDLGESTVQVTVTDQSGNATTETAIVTVSDKIAPVAVAENITVSLGADGTISIDPQLVDGGSTDNADCELTYTLSRTNFSCRDVGRGKYYYEYDGTYVQWGRRKWPRKVKRRGHKVTLTVTDAAGNTDHASAYISVRDDLAPTISTDPITIVVYDRKREYLRWREVYDKVDDNCRVRSVWFGWTKFDKSDAGMNQVRVRASDFSGNVTWGHVNVEVIDISHMGRYVQLCFRGRTKWVKKHQVQKFIRRGATLGTCGNDLSMATGGTSLAESMERNIQSEPLIELGAYPNPTQGMTTITFSSEVAGPASVGVIAPNGNQLATLYDGEIEANENVTVRYNTADLPSGVYIVRLVTAGGIRNLKMMVKK